MAAKQKILVTGSNGQLGKELQQLAPGSPQFDLLFFSKDELPIQDAKTTDAIFKKHQPQYVINCAAYTAVDKAETEKELAFLVNGEAPGVLAAVCKENDARFLHISTDYVFDGTATTPYQEDSATNPQSVYGASKLEGEKQVLRADPGASIIRTSWVYSEFGKNFVKTVLKLMSEREEISVVNDQFGSPTYAADLAGAIMQIIAQDIWQPGIYHYSNNGIISWFDFAVAIKELTGSKCIVHPIPTSAYPTPAKRPAYSVIDKTKIQRVFGISIKDWTNSLAECLVRLKSTGKIPSGPV